MFEELGSDRLGLAACPMISMESQLYQRNSSLLVSMFALTT